MKFKFRYCLPLAMAAIISGCAKKEAGLTLNFPDEYNGERVDLVSFEDSVTVASADITGGKATFLLSESDSLKMPVLAQFMVNGRIKGYYVIEDGSAEWCDTLSVAKGTPLNDKLNALIHELDEAEEAEDFNLLADFAEKKYNENKDNILASFFGVEWLKWADPLKVDSLLNEAPARFKDSKRASRYIKYARLRAKTAPGMPYADFEGTNAAGEDITLSQYVEPGKYTLVDFMASWCPYCIKDMPKLKSISEQYKGNGLNLVSVAVRDEHQATQGAVERHGINWNVVYDAQKRPYELYGFSGIPHYMLIGPDGKILFREGSLDLLRTKLESLWEKK